MEKSTLAAQLRGHFIRQGWPAQEMLRGSDDDVIAMIAGPCGWCGQTHVYGEKLEQVIAVCLDEKHFRSLWNDYNNVSCPTVSKG
jgi:hypothetical protein